METANGAIEHDFHNALVPINGSHSGSSGRSTPNGGDPAPGKLFVGGLSWQTSSEKLREYFGMFGTVTDVLIMKDRSGYTGRSTSMEALSAYPSFEMGPSRAYPTNFDLLPTVALQDYQSTHHRLRQAFSRDESARCIIIF